MNPKKSKEVLKQVIQDNNLDPSFAEDAVSFLWSEIRKNLTEMNQSYLYIDKLGSFKVRQKKLIQHLKNYKKYLDETTPKSFEEYSHRKTIEQRYTVYLKVKEFLDKETENKLKVTERKNEYFKRLEQSEKDSGGDKE